MREPLGIKGGSQRGSWNSGEDRDGSQAVRKPDQTCRSKRRYRPSGLCGLPDADFDFVPKGEQRETIPIPQTGDTSKALTVRET